MLEIKGLTINYGGIEAVRDISFTVSSVISLYVNVAQPSLPDGPADDPFGDPAEFKTGSLTLTEKLSLIPLKKRMISVVLTSVPFLCSQMDRTAI